jgi:sialidase-1
VINEGGGSMTTCGVATVDDGKWHHVMYTRAGQVRTIYIDGNVDFTGSNATIPSLNGSSALNIGQLTGGTQNFIGNIDDVRVYNRALSSAEAKQLYLIGK